jgi:tetratricopeptide (TPR) repeat protein
MSGVEAQLKGAETRAAGRGGWRARAGWWQAAALAAAVILAYQPVWKAGFVWDDETYVTGNRLLVEPDGLRRIWFSLDSPSQYFPLTYSVFWLEWGVWGEFAAGYHWVNILLHAGNGVLLWGLLRRLRLPAPWLAAALFALHPVQVESVAWISELKNVLSLMFCLLAGRAWVEFGDGRRGAWGYYAAALVFQALALFAKTTACTLPAALLLIFWLQGKRIDWRRVAQIVPFVAMGLAMGLLSVWWERNHQGAVGKEFEMGWTSRGLIASRALWFYLGKLFWPAGLSFSYERWNIDPGNAIQYLWLAAWVAAGVVIARSGRGVKIAALYYVAMLAPLLGFIVEYTFLYSYVADHYQYAASIGPLALAAAWLDRGLGRIGWGRNVVCCGALLLLGTLTWRQCGHYADGETLWRATLRENPGSWMAHGNLGGALDLDGKTSEAIREYWEAIRLYADQPRVHYRLGLDLVRRGEVEEGLKQLEEAVRGEPGLAEAHNELGVALSRTGRWDEAMKEYREALELKPGYREAHYNLAKALREKGLTNEAAIQYEQAKPGRLLKGRPGLGK